MNHEGTFVIGTAGHIDHGKSALVKALSGIDPDRLREERERGMTIDLGFAWLRLPSGREVSIVDVPGHERFITNMLAGVGGIDLAVLVVAADEGLMPQTEEHLAILELLRIKRAVVAITKVDLVEPDWLELVQAEISDRLARSPLGKVPIVAVSALTGQGLDDLRARLDEALDDTPPKPNRGRPRLPIDRVFTISGFGTVVTGTLIDGTLAAGQELEIQPGGLRTRARGIQSHKTKVSEAPPGARAAVNLAGVTVEEISRGQVLATPGWLHPTTALDARVSILPTAPPLPHNAAVSFHTGSAEASARVRLLDADALAPGESGWVQLLLSTPVAMVKGDLFILRNPNGTVGGGEVVETHARRHRRRQGSVLERLAQLERGTPEEMILQAAGGRLGGNLAELAERSGLAAPVISAEIRALVAGGQLEAIGERYLTAAAYEDLRRAVEAELAQHHQRYPLRLGMPREEVRSRLRLSAREATALFEVLGRRGVIVAEEALLRLPSHRVAFSPDQERRIDQLLRELSEKPFTPPALDDLAARHGLDEELLAALAARGMIVRVTETIGFSTAAFTEVRERVIQRLQGGEPLGVAEVRDMFDTSRKYALALMEYFDQQRLTRRVGDARVLR